MATAVVAGRRDRSRPANRVLLPQWGARLFGLAALSTVGALEWQRLVQGLSTGRVLLWVLAAVGAALAVLLVSAPPRRHWRLGPRTRAAALLFIVLAALFAGYLLAGPELRLLRPRHWDELVSGLASGLQALGTVRLPYASADPWPRIVLELLGAQLLILAGLLTFWPRVAMRSSERVPLKVPERGYPFVALAVMIVVVASPIISIGGTRPVLLGLIIAALAVCFLWLERLPLRPGLGVAGLLLLALVGALPVAATADRGQPWFDYRAFAESLGPADPVRFSWAQSYGPITWPREGTEVMRIVSGDPLYWKARNLDTFNGDAWQVREDVQDTAFFDEPWEADVPEEWDDRPAWSSEIEVSVKRVQTTDVIGAGTITEVSDNSDLVRPGFSPGTWDAPNGLRRNDSYRARVYVPNPVGDRLEEATTGRAERQDGSRTITVPLQTGQEIVQEGAFGGRIGEARVYFAPFGSMEPSYATYPRRGGRIERSIDEVMERSRYERTWQLVQRLKSESDTSLDFIRAVDAYLHQPEFRYEERPPTTPPGKEPLDYFINESFLGYCQHYAGAMALMLRMGGIAARVATGFSPGGYSESKQAWIVRDTDAHAWVEVWFDEIGWVTVDPTPAATPARSRVAGSITAPPAAAQATPDSGGNSTAPGADGTNPQAVRPDLQTGTGDTTAADDEGGSWRWLLWVGLVIAAIALVLAVVLFIRRPRGATPMDRAIAEVEDALRRVGRPVSTGTTLRELERRLGSSSPEVASYLRALASGRYAPVPERPSRSGRRALRRALAQGLGFGGRLRALWAMPPRVERGWSSPRSRTLEVDASVRA
ncbi:transglutaminase domain-containing protein [Solirubrobacter sp. CPCC 204708]|uniref:Transglutaminase-like domain-containing protein n=1 Tax=Solirubrobacter deserti TaxID=2282478 RepID=A0ABT4REP1_9ACTN|nr:transglutaminase-like domain-containing protein [Solirubrobacter deserti]MBE2318545.1 transglutaminase domain-containing protein [Solirubrobacter deserti]MDA0137003.1 transglutaminase-like domain-containing protein [Solirubrobacter deserti]